MTSTAQLDFTGDASKAQGAFDKLTREFAKLREENRKLNQEVREGSSKSVKSFNDWATGLANLSKQQKVAADGAKAWGSGLKNIELGHSMTGKLTKEMWAAVGAQKAAASGASLLASGVGRAAGAMGGMVGALALSATAVSAAKGAYSSFRTELETLTARHRDFQKELAQGVAFSRDSAQGAEIEQFLSTIPGVKKADAAAVFSGITSQFPSGDLSTRMEMTKAAAGITPLMKDPRGFGAFAGQLGDVMQGAKPEDVIDMAALLHREAGGDVAKLGGDRFQKAIQQLQMAGFSQPEAFGMGLTAAKGEFRGEVLGKMAQVAFASKEELMPDRGAKGRDATLKRQLAGMSGKERIAAMRANPQMAEVGMGDAAMEFQRFFGEDVEKNIALAGSITSQDIVGGMAASARSGPGRGVLSRSALESDRERRQALVAKREELWQQYDIIASNQFNETFAGRTAASIAVATRKVGSAMDTDSDPAKLQSQIATLETLIGVLQKNTEATERNTAASANRRTSVNTHNENN